MKTAALVVLAALAGGSGLLAEPPAADPLVDLLHRGGLETSDLSRGDVRVPGALPHFSRVLADPLLLPRFARALRSAAEQLEGEPTNLFHALLVTTRFSTFTLGGTGNLPEETDLAVALELLRRPHDAPFPWSGSFSSSRLVGERPVPSAASRRDATAVPEALRAPLARLLVALVDAEAWVGIAWRRVPAAAAVRAANRRGLAASISDGDVFFADVEDARLGIDGDAMAYASLKALAGVERAGRELREAVKAAPAGSLESLHVEIDTPRGRVLLGGTGNDRWSLPSDARVLALVDLGGDDRYAGPVAAARHGTQDVSVLLDLSGNDRYEEAGSEPAQGAGLGGVGILWDGEGDDRYSARERSQGFGQLGTGVLVDLGGDDVYDLGESGQGAALFGAGLLFDARGKDRYTILHDGQGFGGPGGAGFLVDAAGDDRYVAVRDPAVAGRPDPRADGKASTSNAQGVGVGRRGDFSDGHSWAGGLGALLDLEGKDSYAGGTWCQGAGYWYGTGILVDAKGDDTYDAVWYALGSAAHHALGLVLDEKGDDTYALTGTGGAGLGFGWDFSAGLFVDLAGNDRYRARRLALGAAMRRSVGLFVDAGGNDVYDVEVAAESLGYTDSEEGGTRPNPLEPESIPAAEAGLFLDLDGSDSYPKGRGADGTTWRPPSPPRTLGAGADLVRAPLPAFLR